MSLFEVPSLSRLGNRFLPAGMIAIACLMSGGPAMATLDVVVSESGSITNSVDGCGTNDPAGCTVEVEKSAAVDTVRTAYLSCASTNVPILDTEIQIDGAPVSWDLSVVASVGGGNFNNVFADITAIVKPGLDAAAAGRTPFTLTETNSVSVEGCTLGVIFDSDSAPFQSVIVSFGAQEAAGDTFSITLAQPVSADLTKFDMGLAISFSFQDFDIITLCGEDAAMDSQVDVQGARLTSCAGGSDDGVGGQAANGLLFTVGGLDDDNDNPADPFQRAGDGAQPRVDEEELYDLLPLLGNGDTLITVDTINPSDDDNIHLAYFCIGAPAIIGEGIVLGPGAATNPVNTQHTVTATVVDDVGAPVVGRNVEFEVTAGPNTGLLGNDATDAGGQASFSYIGAIVGVDTIVARFVDNTGATQTSNAVTKSWESVAVPDGDIFVLERQAFGANIGGVIRVDSVTGAQTVLASGLPFDFPRGISLDASNRPVVVARNVLLRVDPATGVVDTLATGFTARDVVVSTSGRIFVVVGSQIREVNPTNGATSVIATVAARSNGMAEDPTSGALIVGSTDADLVERVDVDTGLVTTVATLPSSSFTTGVTVSADGTAYLASQGSPAGVWVVDLATGTSQLIARTSGSGFPRDVAIAPDGRVVLATSAGVFDFDLSTGASTAISTGGNFDFVEGISIRAVPEPGASVGILACWVALWFMQRRRSTCE